MKLISSIFTLLAAMVLPAAGFMFLSDRDRGYIKSISAGILTYIILRVLMVLPPLNDLNGLFSPLGAAASVYGPALAIAAVSELTRFLVFKYYLEGRRTPGDAVSLGFGFWAVEAILTVGLTALLVVINFSANSQYVNAVNMALSGLERLFVLPVQLLLSLICLYALKSGRYIFIVLGMAVHLAINGTTGLLVAAGFAPAVVIAIMGAAALVCCGVIFKLYSSPTLTQSKTDI